MAGDNNPHRGKANVDARAANYALTILTKSYAPELSNARVFPIELTAARRTMIDLLDRYQQRVPEYRPPWEGGQEIVALKLRQPEAPLDADDLAVLGKVAQHYNDESARWFRKMTGV